MTISKRCISVLLILCMLLSLWPGNVLAADNTPPFTDVKETDWFYASVCYVYENGIMNGSSIDRFSPNSTTTRGMVVTILHRLEGSPTASTEQFQDVANDAYYANGVSWAAGNGIVSGYGNNRFGPEDPITREQLATILYRYTQYKGYHIATENDLSAYSDRAQISAYALEAMAWAVGAELLFGSNDGQLNPLESASRAELAAIFMRFSEGVAAEIPNEDENGGTDSGTGGTGGGTGDTDSGTDGDTDHNKLYTVTFDSCGGSPVESIKIQHGKTISAPEDPVQEGFLFVGWYTSLDYTTTFLFEDIFGENADPVTGDLTLYARWIADNPDALLVQIGYTAAGNSSRYVTGDLSLPATIALAENGNLSITWKSSNSDIISDTGMVTRPQDHDAQVTMTAQITKGSASKDVIFTLTVIHLDSDNNEAVTEYTAEDLVERNGDDCMILNDNMDQVISITGQYTDVTVENAEDALDAIQSVHELLGISDPYNELELSVVNFSETGTYYTFQQTFEGYSVYGCTITVAVDKTGTPDSLSSGVQATDQLTTPGLPTISAEQAQQNAAQYFGGTCQGADSQLLLYALTEYDYDYADNPVLAYAVIVIGTDQDGDAVNHTVFVNAEDGSIICDMPNEYAMFWTNAIPEPKAGQDGAAKPVSIPITVVKGEENTSYTLNTNFNGCSIEVRAGDPGEPAEIVESNSPDKWTDQTAISVYYNAIQAYSWYNDVLGRNSVDGNGHYILIYIHTNGKTDNAAWNGNSDVESFVYYDNSAGGLPTTAVALDIMGHEFTHGVVQFVTGGLPYRNAPGAINEGYADIFGNLIERNKTGRVGWEIGEDWRSLRDMANPNANGSPTMLGGEFYVDYTKSTPTKANDYNGVHTNSSLIYYPAYLMSTDHRSDGFSDEQLARLWYESLFMGYDTASDFYTVRTNVCKAAERLGYSAQQVQVIREAFSDVLSGALDDTDLTLHTLYGRVEDAEDNPVPGAKVTAIGSATQHAGFTDENGEFSFKVALSIVDYEVYVTCEDYATGKFTAKVPILWPWEVDMGTLVLNRAEPQVFASGQVTDAETGMPLSAVTIRFREGHDNRTGKYVQAAGQTIRAWTDQDGTYLVPDLPVGNYTMEAVLSGYNTAYLNIEVSDDESGNNQNITMEPQRTGVIQGTVTNAADGAPLATAMVTVTSISDPLLPPFSCTTDGNGYYQLSVPVGTYCVKITYDGTEFQKDDVPVEHQSSVTVDAALTVSAQMPTALSGSVYDMGYDFDKWTPINKATITLTREDGVSQEITTGSDGTFCFEDYDRNQSYSLNLSWYNNGQLSRIDVTVEIPVGYDLNQNFTFAIKTKTVLGMGTAGKYRTEMLYGAIIRSSDNIEEILPS